MVINLFTGSFYFRIYGLGLLTVFCSVSTFAFLTNNKSKIYLLIALTILASLFFYGFVRVNDNQTVYSNNEVRIVHTHFDQQEKWTLQSIEQTAAMGSPDIMTVFPETSLGFESNRPENWIVGYIRKDQNIFLIL